MDRGPAGTADAAPRRRGIRALTWGALVWVATALFALLFHPQHLSFDSYHYMVLSHVPEVGNAHPLGFGFLLRAMKWFTGAMPWGSFAYVFQLWQVGCLASLVFVAVRHLRPTRGGGHRAPRVPMVLASLLAGAAATLAVPGTVFLMNGYWSEMTSLLAVAVAAMCFERGLGGSRLAWIGFVLASVLGWHVRYQLAFLPVAAVAGALVLTLRRVTGWRGLGEAVIAALVTLAATQASERAMGHVWPTIRMADYSTGDYAQKSIACRLRCDVKLYEKDCSTPEGRKSITRATCTDLIIEQVDLGRREVDPLDLRATFARVGFAGTLRWLAIAPVTYLRERYFSLEHETFGFDVNVRILSARQDVLGLYARLLPQVGAKPSRPFAALVSYLSAAYDIGAFHVLTGASVVIALVVLAIGRSASGVFMALAGIGTYLVFAYLHPKAPLRYLVQVSVPCLIAAATLFHNYAKSETWAGGVLAALAALAARLWRGRRAVTGPDVEQWHTLAPAAPLTRLEYLSVALTYLVMALSLLWFPSATSGVHLDHGWSLAAARFLDTGEQAGTDYVTTYGPLGYLAIGVFYPGLFSLKYAWAVTFAAVAAAVFTRFMTRLGPRWAWAVWVWLVLTIMPHGDVKFVVLMVVIALLHVREGWSGSRVLLTAGVFALLSLVKFTFLLLAVALLVLIPIGGPRGSRPRALANLAGAYALAFVVFWLAAGQSILNVPRFLASSLELARGYSGAMSIVGPEKYVAAAFQTSLLLGLGVFLAPLRWWRGRAQVVATLITGVGLFLSWKEGFVRQDPQHQTSFFGYAAFVVFLLAPFGGGRVSDATPIRRAFLATATLMSLGALRDLSGEAPAAFLRFERARDRMAQQIGILLRPRSYEAEMQGIWDSQRRALALPGVKARVGQASIDVASWDQSIAFWNDFNWLPRPIAQGFSAWTPWLAELNGRHLSGTGAPRFVLVRWASIDRRFPAHDDGAFLIELLRRYQPVFQEKDYLLFERQGQPASEVAGEVVLRRRITIGETLQLDLDPAELNTLSVAIDPTWVGVWRRFTYKAPYLGFLTRQGNGEIKRYDLVPELARREFVLTPLVEGNIDFPWIYDGTGRKLEWIRFELDREGRACFGDTVEVTIRRYPGVVTKKSPP